VTSKLRRSIVGRSCTLLLLGGGACAASSQANSDLIGAWSGRALFRGAPLAFTVRFFRERDTLRATFSSSDLLILDQPLDSVEHNGARVSFSTRDDYPIRFHGTVAGEVIRGDAGVPAVPGVTDGHGASAEPPLQFELRRVVAAPTPYATREIRFGSDGIELAGTLLLPPAHGAARLPGIVILQGSSTNLRQEYQFYADHFARAGLAVVAFDKRGTGESSGDYGAATYEDLAADAAAAIQFLRRQPGIDSSRVGVWGLSQGAFISPLVTRRAPAVAFVVAVSPPGVTIGESAAYQDSVRLIGKKFSTSDARQAAGLNRHIYEWLRTGRSRRDLGAELVRAADRPWRRASSLPTRLPTGASLEGWYWRGRTLDPIPLWRALRIPVLVVFGGADELVPSAIGATRIRGALREGGNRDATIRVFPAANHVLRQLPLVAGGKWDWPKAAPGYLDGITTWIIAHSR
jgi:uncharacterized protein